MQLLHAHRHGHGRAPASSAVFSPTLDALSREALTAAPDASSLELSPPDDGDGSVTCSAVFTSVSVATSRVTLHSTTHSRERLEERDILRRSLQEAVKHAAHSRTPEDRNGERRWRIKYSEYNGVVFITDHMMKVAITAWRVEDTEGSRLPDEAEQVAAEVNPLTDLAEVSKVSMAQRQQALEAQQQALAVKRAAKAEMAQRQQALQAQQQALAEAKRAEKAQRQEEIRALQRAEKKARRQARNAQKQAQAAQQPEEEALRHQEVDSEAELGPAALVARALLQAKLEREAFRREQNRRRRAQGIPTMSKAVAARLSAPED
eukprot:3327541-Prymnesium_polylepis.1